jgi:hypothetical protein
MTDVLAFTPVYRLEPETVRAVLSLEREEAISLLFQHDNPTGNPYLDHLHQYQRARDLFLSGPYGAMLVIESDIIPPPDTLTRLEALDCDVAYGCYQFRNNGVSNILQRYKPHPEPVRNLGESLSVTPGLWKAARKQGIIDCSGAGLGCILIQRRVLEETPFVGAPTDPAKEYFDWHWTQAVFRKGYRMRAEMQVLCGHKNTDGVITWPPS